jgi:rare lipoprotein A
MTFRPRHIPVLIAAAFAAGPGTPAAAQQADNSGTGGIEAVPGTLEVRGAPLAQRPLRLAGNAGPGGESRRVVVERQLPGGRWERIASTRADDDGAFAARWITDTPGRFALRARVPSVAGRAQAAQSRDLFARVTVYAAQVASWYGPGFFGRRTACGIDLSRDTVGVAHKRLPCGTRVEIYHRGRTLEVPVIDRGPYVAGRQWDLTQAAAEALGVTATARVGVLPAA